MAPARKHEPESLMRPAAWRFQNPKNEKDNNAAFGIAGDSFFDTIDLSWEYVAAVLKALRDVIETRDKLGEGCVKILFWIAEEGVEGKEELGDGYVSLRRPE